MVFESAKRSRAQIFWNMSGLLRCSARILHDSATRCAAFMGWDESTAQLLERCEKRNLIAEFTSWNSTERNGDMRMLEPDRDNEERRSLSR